MLENKPDKEMSEEEIPEPEIINVVDHETSDKGDDPFSPPASESIDGTSSSQLSLNTKMDRFFDSMKGEEPEPPNSMEVAEIAVQIPERQDFSCQTDEPAATKEKGLLITCIPASLSSITKIAFSMEKHGALESLKVWLNNIVYCETFFKILHSFQTNDNSLFTYCYGITF